MSTLRAIRFGAAGIVGLFLAANAFAFKGGDGPLFGEWTDSEGNRIYVLYDGPATFDAYMQSERGRKFWTQGRGKVQGNQVSFTVNGSELNGTLRNQNLIGWSNGSTWQRGKNRTGTLTGLYEDSNGDSIRVIQFGNEVIAVMVSDSGKKHWRDVQGQLNGNTLAINFPGVGRVNGSVLPDAIKWSNGTGWKRRRADGFAGIWTDSENHKIRIEQKGKDVRATMLSEAGRRYWTVAEGTIRGNKITFNFPNSDGTQIATVRNDNLLVFTNGSNWVRNF